MARADHLPCSVLTVVFGKFGHVVLEHLRQASGTAPALGIASLQGGVAARKAPGCTVGLDGGAVQVPEDASLGEGVEGRLVDKGGVVAIDPVLGLELPVAQVAVAVGQQERVATFQAPVGPIVDLVLDAG